MLAICLCLSLVLYHARLVRSETQANATLKQPPPRVQLWFNEELQAQFNTITVTDQSGKRVDKNNVGLADGSKTVQVDLEEIPSGTYTVVWKALSADQHTIKGQFTFMLALTAPAPSASSTNQVARQTQPPPSPAESTQESGATLSLSVVRWLEP